MLSDVPTMLPTINLQPLAFRGPGQTECFCQTAGFVQLDIDHAVAACSEFPVLPCADRIHLQPG